MPEVVIADLFALKSESQVAPNDQPHPTLWITPKKPVGSSGQIHKVADGGTNQMASNKLFADPVKPKMDSKLALIPPWDKVQYISSLDTPKQTVYKIENETVVQ